MLEGDVFAGEIPEDTDIVRSMGWGERKKKMIKMIEAKLFEEGNGFPNVGDYVGDCESLYQVESLVNCIHTSRPGE